VPAASELGALLALQRGAGNRAVSRMIGPPTVQRDCEYEPGEKAAAYRGSILSPDVRKLASTGSGYNASADSVLVADFEPNSARVRTDATGELRASWRGKLERDAKQRYALLGFSDCTGDETTNTSLRSARARAVAAMLPKTAARGVVGAAPAGDFIKPGNSNREERALNRSVLIRLPPEELSQSVQVDEYSADAVAYWRANPGSTVNDLVTFTSGRAQARLVANGVPLPKVVPGTSHAASPTMAYFDPRDWTITIDLAKITSDVKQAGVTATTKLSTLDAESVAILSKTSYHEARHAEQTFLAARLEAEEKGSRTNVDRLARSMGIQPAIAQKAIDASAVTMPDVLKAKARDWLTFSAGGRHLPYKAWNEGLKNELTALLFVYSTWLQELAKTGSTVGIRVTWERGLHPKLDKTFRRDYSYRADTMIKNLKKSPHQDQVDLDVRTALEKTAGLLFIMLVKEREAAKLPTVDQAASMDAATATAADERARLWLLELQITLLQLQMAIDEAYRAYPHEADAYKVEAQVAASIKEQARP
jgi:outer membrane protein OmpA-like peptidoglycan-associated protein